MFSPDQYQLLDFGQGRKLERFGPLVLDRPSPPATDTPPRKPQLWSQAASRYHRRGSSLQGVWEPGDLWPSDWSIRWRSLVFELKANPFGHLGVFPEQATNWDWLARLIAAGYQQQNRGDDEPVRVLNLFAYTGGSTMAAAAAGAHVAHVDAARNVVAWARSNAARSGLAEAPIRWLAEDAALFAARERKRGRRYDIIVLDPPSYGHGPKGQPWQLEKDLPGLLADCAALLSEQPLGVLFTCHSPGFDEHAMQAALVETGFPLRRGSTDGGELTLATAEGRKLHAGWAVRWSTVELT